MKQRLARLILVSSVVIAGTYCAMAQVDVAAKARAMAMGNSGEGTGHAITSAQEAHLVQQGPCHAVVPAGWTLAPGPNGQTADLTGPNGAHASWGILAVNPAMRRFYGDMYGPPDTHAAAILGMMLQGSIQFLSSDNVQDFYTMHRFQGAGVEGVALYHTYPAAMGQYIISEYFAWAPQGDAALLSQATAVMTSLSCTSSVRPSEQATYKPHSGVPDRRRSGSSSEGDSLKDYNSTLGTQYAHDSAGRTYLLDRATQWNDTGPDGAGFYVGSGVNREKLTPGLE